MVSSPPKSGPTSSSPFFKRIVLIVALFGTLIFAFWLFVIRPHEQSNDHLKFERLPPRQREAVLALRQLGSPDYMHPGDKVTFVNLHRTEVTDDALEHVAVVIGLPVEVFAPAQAREQQRAADTGIGESGVAAALLQY